MSSVFILVSVKYWGHSVWLDVGGNSVFVSILWSFSYCISLQLRSSWHLWLNFLTFVSEKMLSKLKSWFLEGKVFISVRKSTCNHKLECLSLPYTANKKSNLCVPGDLIICPWLFNNHRSSWDLGPHFDDASRKLFYEFLLEFEK